MILLISRKLWYLKSVGWLTIFQKISRSVKQFGGRLWKQTHNESATL
jgi:hypothetical protein